MAKDNTIQIKFRPDGHEKLIKAIEKLHEVSKKLIKQQDGQFKSGKKVSNEFKRLDARLKGLGSSMSKAGVKGKLLTNALNGNKVALEKVKNAVNAHVRSLKGLDVQTKKTSARTRILGGTVAVARSKLLLFNFILGLGIRQLGRFGEEASKVESMERAFNTLTGGTELSSEAMNKLQEATNNTMSQFDLFQQANNAMVLGVSKNSDEMAEMFDIAQRLGRALGRDTASSVESLVTGIGRQSRLMLDNIGIIVKSEEAYEAYAEKLGVSTDELSDADKKQAFLSATMESARKKIKDLGDEVLTNQDSYDKLKASSSNLATELGNTLQPVLSGLSKGFASIADSITETLKVTRIANKEYDMDASLQERREIVLARITKAERKLAYQRATGADDVVTTAKAEAFMASQRVLLHNLDRLIRKDQERKIQNNKDEQDSLKELAEQEKKKKEASEKAIEDEKIRVELGKKLAKEQEQLRKDIANDEKQHAKNLKSARDTIFESSVDYQLMQLDLKAEEIKALGLNGHEQIALERYIAEEKQKIIKEDADTRQKIIDESNDKIKQAREDIHQNDLHYHFLELEAKRKHYESLAQTDEDRRLVEEFVREQQKELATAHLEENNALYNATLSSYDAFVTGLMDKDTNFLESRQAMENAFKESLIRFLADLIKEQVKAFLIEGAIRKASDKATEKDAMKSGAKIFASYAGAAKVKAIATSGASVIAAGVATKAYSSQVDSMQKFEQGGLIGGRRHSQGGTIIEAEQGEFIMNRNAVDSIGLNSLSQMNETGSKPITVNINGHVLGTRSFVRDFLIPEIHKTVKRGLA